MKDQTQTQVQAQDQAQTQTQDQVQFSTKQVYNLLFNGLHKDQAGIPAGLHKIKDLQTRFADKIKDFAIPANAQAVFFCYNNIVAIITSAGLTINTSAESKITDLQKAGLQLLKDQAQAKNKAIESADLGWQGKAGQTKDQVQALNNKIAGLF